LGLRSLMPQPHLLMPLLPASHALLAIGTLVAERLLYTPSGGFCMLRGLYASVVLRVATRQPTRRLLRSTFLGLLVVVVLMASGRTWLRNRDWSDSDSVSRATARVCPSSAKAQLSLGTAHLQSVASSGEQLSRGTAHLQRGDLGGLGAAHAAFRTALRIHPEYADALYWLGRLGVLNGELPAAERLLLASLELNLGHPEANLFAAICLARRGEDAPALRLLRRAYQLAPHNAEIVRDYGAMLVRVSQPERALPILRDAVVKLTQIHARGDPTTHSRSALASAHVKLAAAHLLLNQHAACRRATRAAVALEPLLGESVAPMHQLCKRAHDGHMDTSQVTVNLAL